MGIQQGAAAMAAMEKWQNVIAGNIASSSVAGHKKTTFAVEAQAAGSLSINSGSEFGSVLASKMPVSHGRTSFSDGDAILTGKATDCALRGDGFFSIKSNDSGVGEIYTRNGEFHINSERTLVDSSGREIMGTGGSIQLSADGGEVSLDNSGNIYQGSTKVGSLKITQFENLDALVRIQGGFASLDDKQTIPSAVASPNIMSGYIEGSNASSIREMTNLITAGRAHESNLKVVGLIDQRNERMTRMLGNTK